MLNRIFPLAALLLGLGAAPVFAQSAEDTAAARTLAQNRKVMIGRPAGMEQPATPQAATAPAPAPRRVKVAAETGRPPAR
jgi:hypothetical protein